MQTNPSDSSVSHWRDLDGARGILALVVMSFHYGINVLLARLTGGLVREAPWELAVDFFFVLSGCVLARSYLERPRGLGRRFVERFFRLWPVHLVTFLAFVPLVLASPGNPWFHATRTQGAAGLVADLTTTSIYLGYEQWNFAAWAVGIELVVPVLLAMLLPLARQASTPVLAAVLVVLMILETRCVATIVAVGGASAIERGVLGISLGAVLYLLLEKRALAIPRTSFAVPLLLAITLAEIGLVRTLPMLAYPIPALFVLTVLLGTNSAGMLGRGVFKWLGAITYTVYLAHLPMKAWAYCLLDIERFDGRLDLKAALIVAVLLVATALTRFVELPGIRLGKLVASQLEAARRRTGPGLIEAPSRSRAG